MRTLLTRAQSLCDSGHAYWRPPPARTYHPLSCLSRIVSPAAPVAWTRIGLQREVDVPAVAHEKAEPRVLEMGVRDLAAGLGLGRAQEDRDPHPRQHADLARGGRLAGPLQRRKFLDEDAIRLLARRERRRRADPDLSLLARLEHEKRREDGDVLRGEELHLALLVFVPAECRELEPERLLALVGERQQAARRRGRQGELNRRDAEGRGRGRSRGQEGQRGHRGGDASGSLFGRHGVRS